MSHCTKSTSPQHKDWFWKEEMCIEMPTLQSVMNNDSIIFYFIWMNFLMTNWEEQGFQTQPSTCNKLCTTMFLHKKYV